MRLTNDNYYSPEADRRYMSVSQFKAFMSCEAAAMAQLRGEYHPPMSTAMLVGSYVDAWFEGTLGSFIAAHPQLIKRDGSLRAEYSQAVTIIQRVSRDRLFMEYMSGQKQRIFTGELFGAEWKIKIDSLHPDKIVDLKVMRTLTPIMGQSFIEHWGYDIQAAVYQAVEGGDKPFYLAAVTKETPPDLEIIHISRAMIDNALDYVGRHIQRVLAVRSGEVEPLPCGICPYCRSVKSLTAPIEADWAGLSIYERKRLKGEYI